MKKHVNFIKRLVAQGGPRQTDYDEFYNWVFEIYKLINNNQISKKELSILRDNFKDAFSPLTMQGFSFVKPHGYAGDYEIIDRIYQKYICSLPHLKAWDHLYQSCHAARAVRNRKDYFHQLLDYHISRCSSLRVLKIASGPGRSMFEWLSAHPDASIHLDCIELDPNAIEYASRLNQNFLDKISFTQTNFLSFTPEGHYDLIWASGIFDYFNDRTFKRQLKKLLPVIAEDGEIVIGNFTDKNPSKFYMELFEWILNYRNADKLTTLAKFCDINENRIKIGSEPLGVNLFLHIQNSMN